MIIISTGKGGRRKERKEIGDDLQDADAAMTCYLLKLTFLRE